jgi:squalene cyclase
MSGQRNALLNKLKIVEERAREFLKRSQLGDGSFDVGGKSYGTSLVLPALCDAGSSQKIVQKSLHFLMQTRDPSSGLWSFVPSSKPSYQLPPDTDSTALACIASILGARYLEDEDSLAKAMSSVNTLATLQRRNGSFPTWIANTGAYPIASLHSKTNASCVEIVATVLQALRLAGKAMYNSHIKSGVSFISRKRSSRGYWKCTWYFSRYYAIFRATAAGYFSRRTLNLLSQTQCDNGGWPRDEGANPLDTAFALLSLLAISSKPKAVVKAVEYLTHCQTSDGLWEHVPLSVNYPLERFYFRKRIGLPVETYGSEVTTTAFCLQALVSAKKSLG